MPIFSKNTGKQTDTDTTLRRLITRIIRECSKKRPQIAEEIDAIIGQRVTVNMLNDFTSEGKKPARFPALFVSAFSEVTGCDELQRFVLSPRMRELLQLGEAVERLIDEHARGKLLRNRNGGRGR